MSDLFSGPYRIYLNMRQCIISYGYAITILYCETIDGTLDRPKVLSILKNWLVLYNVTNCFDLLKVQTVNSCSTCKVRELCWQVLPGMTDICLGIFVT